MWRCVSFLVLAGNSFWCYILYILSTYCTIQLCDCVSFLVVAGNSSQNENTFWFPMSSFYKKILLGYGTLLWSTSQCVYFVRPNTLLLCIFLFCIFLLYRKDQQVEVQIRILLKDKYVKSCQNANTGNHTLISRTMLIGFLYFRETTC